MPSYYLNQYWNTVNRTLGNTLQWNINWTQYIFIRENIFENVFCKIACISFWSQIVNRFKIIQPGTSSIFHMTFGRNYQTLSYGLKVPRWVWDIFRVTSRGVHHGNHDPAVPFKVRHIWEPPLANGLPKFAIVAVTYRQITVFHHAGSQICGYFRGKRLQGRWCLQLLYRPQGKMFSCI